MIIDRESPASIYAGLSREIDLILDELAGSSDDEQVSLAKSNARAVLESHNSEIKRNIAELDRHAEWETFTVAFYGETNAGKSTIIEVLRIICDERTKSEERQKFRQIQAEYDLTEERFASLAQVISETSQSLIKLENQRRDVTRRYDVSDSAIRDEIRQLRDAIREKRTKAPLWQRLLNKIRKSREQRHADEALLRLQAVEIEKKDEVEQLDLQYRSVQKQKILAEQEIENLQSLVEKMKCYADGTIIGTGRSDFTLETKEYVFDNGGEKFKLLDVPGIEGNEAKVIDNIWTALHKAHAVFFVTGKAAAPQKGEENNKGTLEKIKDHLGDQTEIWTIFNKRITNPIQLEKGNLTSQDERESLSDLDDKMREQLGGNYQGVIPLSAHPAFLAVAECLVPGSPDADRKRKFLSTLQARDLLSKSNFLYLENVLNDDLLKSTHAKVRRSNFNKARAVVLSTAAIIATIQCESFQPLSQNLKQEAENAGNELETVLAAFKRRLESQIETAINYFTTSARRKIYECIEKDIPNSDFKDALEHIIKCEQENLQQKLPTLLDDEIKKFQRDISDVIDRFQQFSSELIDVYEKIRVNRVDGSLSLRIKIDNGLNVGSLLGSLVGGVMLIWNPGGWLIIAVGAATFLVSFSKALYGMFSTDYKKSQQRKSASENLNSVAKSMRGAIHKNLAETFPELQLKVEGIKVAFENTAHQVAGINATLISAVAQLTKLASHIEKVGAE